MTPKIIKNENFIALFYILASIFLGAVAYGINYVIFPATLIKHDISSFLIGLSASIELLAGVIISFIISKIVSRISVIKAVLLFGIFYATSIFLIYFYQNYFLWIGFCAINGACWFSLLVIRNAWINRLLHDKNRSIVLALTTTVFCIGFACGSLIIKNLGAQNHAPFLISSGFIVFSILSLLLVKNSAPQQIHAQRIGFIEFFRQAPNIAIARFALEFQNVCIVALTIIFGVKIGLTPENAGLLIAAFMASGFCDLYAGFLVQKYDRKKMIIFGFFGCLTTMTIAVFAYKSFVALLILYFLFGASTAAIFVATLTITNEIFPHEKLIAANATFQSFGSFGAVVGSVVGGLFIDFLGFYGFFATIILSDIFYLIFAFCYEKKSPKNSFGR